MGPEFTNNAMKAYLDSIGIKPRIKSKGDPNTLGVVDKAIQTMKKKLATIRGTEGGNWESLLARVSKSMNTTPKPDVLHGEAPNDVKDNPEVRFMLNQDNARKIKHNDNMRNIKENTRRPWQEFPRTTEDRQGMDQTGVPVNLWPSGSGDGYHFWHRHKQRREAL